LFIDIEAKLQL